MEKELLQVAIHRAYSALDLSTQLLLSNCQTRLAKIPQCWYIGIFAPSSEVYEGLIEQLEPLTRALTRVMGDFRIGVCTEHDPIPPGGDSMGIVTDRFFIDATWYYQIKNQNHHQWCEVAPEHLIRGLP